MALSFFSSASSPFPIPIHVSSVRIKHAFTNINIDANLPIRGVAKEVVERQLKKRTTSSAFVDPLWKNPSNQNLVSRFLNNKFCLTCARSSDETCLPLYRKYSAQDYFFLEDYIKFKARRLTTLPQGDLDALAAEVEAIASDTNYTVGAKETYLTQLRGKESDLAETNRNIALLAYGSVLQNAASEQDWFNLHVIVIPCLYGWAMLAQKLQKDPLTKKDTVFYKTWIQPNADPVYSDALSAFLDANQVAWRDSLDTGTGVVGGRWNYLFRLAMKLEIALFASAFEN